MKSIFSYFIYLLIPVLLITSHSNIVENKKIDKSKNEITVYIPKINLKKNTYSFNDQKNDVNKNIFLAINYDFNTLKGSTILAAHSGNSEVSYFYDLDKLGLNDEIIIETNNKIISYEVDKIYLINKTGKFNYQDYDKGIYLITCSKKYKKKQLVIYAKSRKILEKSAFF